MELVYVYDKSTIIEMSEDPLTEDGTDLNSNAEFNFELYNYISEYYLQIYPFGIFLN